MLGQCWASVVDGGPALTQHCVNVLCLLGRQSERKSPLRDLDRTPDPGPDRKPNHP